MRVVDVQVLDEAAVEHDHAPTAGDRIGMSDLPGLHRGFNVSAETQAAFPSAVLLNVFNLVNLVEEVLAIMGFTNRIRRPLTGCRVTAGHCTS